jgi:hypothetical protein
VKHVKRARILTPREIHQLVRVHKQITALLASNGVTLTTRRSPPKAKGRPSSRAKRGR